MMFSLPGAPSFPVPLARSQFKFSSKRLSVAITCCPLPVLPLCLYLLPSCLSQQV